MSPFPETSPSYSHSIQHVHHFREMRCLKHTMFFPFRKSPARWFNHQGTKELVDSDLAEESRSLSVDPTVNVWWFFDLLQRWHSMAGHGTVVSGLKKTATTSTRIDHHFHVSNVDFRSVAILLRQKNISKTICVCLKIGYLKIQWFIIRVYPHFQTGPKLFFYNLISLMGHNNPQYG